MIKMIPPLDPHPRENVKNIQENELGFCRKCKKSDNSSDSLYKS